VFGKRERDGERMEGERWRDKKPEELDKRFVAF
jgi:hypothetical protein